MTSSADQAYTRDVDPMLHWHTSWFLLSNHLIVTGQWTMLFSSDSEAMRALWKDTCLSDQRCQHDKIMDLAQLYVLDLCQSKFPSSGIKLSIWTARRMSCWRGPWIRCTLNSITAAQAVTHCIIFVKSTNFKQVGRTKYVSNLLLMY